MVPRGVAVVLALVGVWVCGCFAQTKLDNGFLTQDMSPREGKTCDEIRYNVEQMMYETYKATIPQLTLKDVLPGLAEPLLPLECQQAVSQGKGLQETPPPVADPSATATTSSRPRRQVGLMTMKDPGDHPPPGMMRNPMKDPGDRPMFGMGGNPMKDPGDRVAPMGMGLFNFGGGGGGGEAPPAGEGAAPPSGEMANPLFSSIMAMAGMMGARRPAFGGQPFRGGFYGDAHPGFGRKKRSTDAANSLSDEEVAAAHSRQKRANGEEEKKGMGFDVFPPFFMPSPFNFFQAPGSRYDWFSGPPRQNRLYSPNGQLYGNAPSYRQAPPRRQAPVNSFPGSNRGGMGNNGGGRASGRRSSGPVMSISSLFSPAARTPAAAPASQPRPGMMFGDALPSYGTPAGNLPPGAAAPQGGRGRRVKRASDGDSSSDPGPSDVVTFGDVSIPADTFNNMINPQRPGVSDDQPPPPPPRYQQPYRPPPPPLPPAYYPPPRQYFPPQQYMRQPSRAYNMLARQRAMAARRRAAGYPMYRSAMYSPATRAMAQQRPMVAQRPLAMQQAMHAPLPMGAAQPMIYGTRPAY